MKLWVNMVVKLVEMEFLQKMMIVVVVGMIVRVDVVEEDELMSYSFGGLERCNVK